MRALLALITMAFAALMFDAGANLAQEKKDVVLKGKITCAKCELKIAKKCTTVIVVKGEGDKKDVIYYFDADAHKLYHDGICADPKNGMIEGTVSVVDKKKVVSVKKLTFDK